MKDINAITAKFFKDYPNATHSKNDFTTERVALVPHNLIASFYFTQPTRLSAVASL